MIRMPCKMTIPRGFLTLFCLFLSKMVCAEPQNQWIDSRPFLVEVKKPESPDGFLFIRTFYGAVARSLANPDQHRSLLEMHGRTGTKAREARIHSLSIQKLSSSEATTAPTEVTRTMSSFLGREFKSSALPSVMRSGFSFDVGSSSKPEPKATAATPVRYGLILTNVEPSTESFRFASLGNGVMDDYALVSYAPKAKVNYAIGPITSEQDVANNEVALATSSTRPWTDGLPEFRFRGKIAARGAPSAAQIVPPQAITLEQTQGFYAIEIQTSQLIHKDTIIHRTRVPLLGSMNWREERNENFKKTRSTLENIYARGPLALNLDYFGLEKRYQTGLIYQKALTRFELYNHLPQDFSSQGNLWKLQRFELRLQTGF